MNSEMQKILKTIIPGKDILILDADEVLLLFITRLEAYLESTGFELKLNSFRLGGNIFKKGHPNAVEPAGVKALISRFFDACVDDIPAAPGAAEALEGLRDYYQIVILSNVPAHCQGRRMAHLEAHGMPYPVIANKGDKGQAVLALSKAAQTKTTQLKAIQAKAIFIDDLPPQISSVAACAPDTHRIHFIADPRVAKLIGKADHAHVRFDTWPLLQQYLQNYSRGPLQETLQGHPHA